MKQGAGGGRDLVHGPILSALLFFSLPTLGSSILQSLNGSINAIWVGHFLGEQGLAATANANLVMFLCMSTVFGFGMAATILIGQSIGRRDLDGARRVLGTAITLFAMMAILACALGWFFAPNLLRALATSEQVYPLALSYLRVIFLGLPAGFMTVLLSMALRGAGDAMTPLWFMIMGSVIDVGLNPVFILGLAGAPALGIAGSALANLLSNCLTLMAFVIFIYARKLPLRLRGREFRYLRPDPRLLATVLEKGVPMGLQILVVSLSAVAMIGLVNRGGTAVTAAYGAANQLWTYIQMPAMAVGGAVSAMAAQNIGAGRWDRVDKITRAGIQLNILQTGTLVLVLIVIDRHLLSLFLGKDGIAIDLARHVNFIASWSFILFGITMVLAATVRANGAVMAPLFMLILTLFGFRFGVSLAGYSRFGEEAIWWSFPISSIASVLMQFAYYRYGRWRKIKLTVPHDSAPIVPEPV